MSSAKQRLVIILPPMLTVPSKASVMILSRNMLKRVGESRDPCPWFRCSLGRHKNEGHYPYVTVDYDLSYNIVVAEFMHLSIHEYSACSNVYMYTYQLSFISVFCEKQGPVEFKASVFKAKMEEVKWSRIFHPYVHWLVFYKIGILGSTLGQSKLSVVLCLVTWQVHWTECLLSPLSMKNKLDPNVSRRAYSIKKYKKNWRDSLDVFKLHWQKSIYTPSCITTEQ